MIDWTFWMSHLMWFVFGGSVVFIIMAWIVIAVMDAPLYPESYDDLHKELYGDKQ